MSVKYTVHSSQGVERELDTEVEFRCGEGRDPSGVCVVFLQARNKGNSAWHAVASIRPPGASGAGLYRPVYIGDKVDGISISTSAKDKGRVKVSSWEDN